MSADRDEQGEVDATSLVGGGVLLALGTAVLVAEGTGSDLDAAWLLSALLLATGVTAVLLGLARAVRVRRRARVEDEPGARDEDGPGGSDGTSVGRGPATTDG